MKNTSQQNPLLPLIELAKQRGMKTKIMLRVLGKGGTANWGQVSDWLHADETKRRMPRADTLKILLAVQKDMLPKRK